jgi:hypothetical protein
MGLGTSYRSAILRRPVKGYLAIALPRLAGPFPNIAEHVTMYLKRPTVGERGSSPIRLLTKVFENGLVDVLCFNDV